MSKSTLSNRFGKFSISRKLIELHPEDVMAILGDVVVVRAEMHFATDCVEYTGMSPKFEYIQNSEIIPRYSCVANENGWEWVRDE